MYRSRLILLVVIIFSVVLLYQLPRVVVDNSDPASEMAATAVMPDAELPVEGESPGIVLSHTAEIPDSVLSTINNLRESLFSVQNQQKRLIFADSLARLFSSMGKYDSAARYYDLKASILPGSEQYIEAGDAYYEAMSFTMDKGRRMEWAEKAREFYSKVLAESPDLPDITVKIGMTYLSGDNPMAGIQMIRKVAEEHPDNQLALYQLGMLSVTTNQYDKAIERFEQLIRLNEDHGEGHFYLGYCYFEKGQREKARLQFEKVLNLKVSQELMEASKKYLENINNI